jgi:hypothetical protein
LRLVSSKAEERTLIEHNAAQNAREGRTKTRKGDFQIAPNGGLETAASYRDGKSRGERFEAGGSGER